MAKDEFLQVLECFALWVEDRKETQNEEHTNTELFEADNGEIPF